MPNGYSDAKRIFIKILKPVFGHLRQEDLLSVIFVDDSYLLGETEQECANNTKATVQLLLKLDFIVHEEKSSKNKISGIYYWVNGKKAAHILLKIRKFWKTHPHLLGI